MLYKCIAWVLTQLFIGTLALLVSLIRIVLNHFTNKHHIGFESAIWYWHFVDGAGVENVIYWFIFFISNNKNFYLLNGQLRYFGFVPESFLLSSSRL